MKALVLSFFVLALVAGALAAEEAPQNYAIEPSETTIQGSRTYDEKYYNYALTRDATVRGRAVDANTVSIDVEEVRWKALDTETKTKIMRELSCDMTANNGAWVPSVATIQVTRWIPIEQEYRPVYESLIEVVEQKKINDCSAKDSLLIPLWFNGARYPKP